MIKQQQQQLILQGNTSTNTNTRRVIPSSNHHRHHHHRASDFDDDISNKLLTRQGSSSPSISSFHSQLLGVADRNSKPCTRPSSQNKFSSIIRSFLNIFTFPSIFIPTCKWLTIPNTSHLSITPSLGRKVTGTLFGHRRGHISFAVQLDPRSEPLLLLELAISTSSLVKEMSSGLVRIALECEKQQLAPNNNSGRGQKKLCLFHEPSWSMYCNGRKCGYALTRTCGDRDWHVLSTVQSVSVGAGVIPLLEEKGEGGGGGGDGGGGSEGELMYMRARFERVVGSRDSEAFYMLNPDGNGGPELSIFLLRI